MPFTLDPQVAAVLAAAIQQNGPPPALQCSAMATWCG